AGQALGGDEYAKDAQRMNGENLNQAGHHIVPATKGEGYELTTPLRPLAALRDDFSLVSGLRIPYSTISTEPSEVPPGGAFRDFHGGGASPLLSGVRSTSSSFSAGGISSDQAIARLHMGESARPSLVLRAQPSFYLTGYSFAGRHRISYRGAGDPIEAQDSPRTAYASLFADFMSGGGPTIDWNLRARRSVLDLITGKRQRLLGMLGAADRERVGRHFDEIRALEQRLMQIPEAPQSACTQPADPGTDPAVGGDNAGSTSSDIATNTGYSGEHERARFMLDLIHMAFVCDLTRVATLQITAFQSHMNTYAISQHFDSPVALSRPLQADLHEVGHNGDADFRGQLPVSLCLQWHIGHYAYLLDKLKQTPEGAGTLLDNSVIVFMPEAGHGRHLNTPSDTAPRTHSVDEMILLVGGRAGGLRPGRHIATAGAHPVQCLLGCMQAVGYQEDQLGEVSGALGALRS
ncbi:MAG TPA: DUF1552 domain-containing protein, partial [Polyangiales bacterium]|nr:DUF1552 domain-containing protein [Polyangiales bacterium]